MNRDSCCLAEVFRYGSRIIRGTKYPAWNSTQFSRPFIWPVVNQHFATVNASKSNRNVNEFRCPIGRIPGRGTSKRPGQNRQHKSSGCNTSDYFALTGSAIPTSTYTPLSIRHNPYVINFRFRQDTVSRTSAIST